MREGEFLYVCSFSAACHLERSPHFAADDIGQRRLAESRRTVQQHMVERLVAHLGRLDEDRQVVDDLILPAERGQLLRTDFVLELEVGLYVADIGHTMQR